MDMISAQKIPSFDDVRTKSTSNNDCILGRQGPCTWTRPRGKSVFVKSCTSGAKGGRIQMVSQHHIFGRFFISISNDLKDRNNQPCSYFSIQNSVQYEPFCDDFGPMSLGSVVQFCEIVEEELLRNQNKKVALQVQPDSRSITNAAFLVGAYMILKLGSSPDEVSACMKPLSDHLLSYRDVSPGEQNFHLHLKDCWAGLHKAKTLRWVDLSSDGFDAAEYAHYDNPLNADLHEIVPGKFFAMRGPVDLPAGQAYRDVFAEDGRFVHREFSPTHYVQMLKHLEVQAVVRLNESEYSKDAFTTAGLGFADLPFEDCKCPPADVVAKFMLIAEGLPGPLAVHCKAGLGRTGTLIALYMMAHCGFSAREAMGWIRIVRPGSIIGAQQQYLCEREAVMRRTGEQFRQQGPACALKGTREGVAMLIEEAVRVVDVRLHGLRVRRRLTSTFPGDASRVGEALRARRDTRADPSRSVASSLLDRRGVHHTRAKAMELTQGLRLVRKMSLC